jgi:signal transduction histidine kinase
MSTPWSMKSLLDANPQISQQHELDEREAMLRHDMVNCLTAMHLQIELLRRRAVLGDAQAKALVEYILRMEELMQEWRHFSSSQLPRKVESVFNLSDVVLNIVDANRAYAVLNDQSLTMYMEATPAIMTGDQSQIQRALDNVLSNAMKYTPTGGAILVSMIVEDSKAVISIADTGIGIPTDEQPHIFKPFFRARNAVDHQIPGTGLGLAQVKEAVEQHGGTVHLRSKHDQGTQINLYLPLKIERSASVI